MVEFNLLIPAIALIPALAGYPFTCVFVLLFIGGLAQEHARNPELAASQTLGLSTLAGGWITGVNLPEWALSLPIFIILPVLVAAEWSSEQSAAHQDIIGFANRFIKPGAGIVVQYGLVSGQAAEIMELVALALPPDLVATLAGGTAVASVSAAAAQPAEGLMWLVQVLAFVWALIAGGAIWLITGLRNDLIAFLTDIDADGDLGLLRLFAVADGGWAVTTTLVLIFFPLLALLMAGAALAGLWLAGRYFERRERKSMVACGECGGQMFPTALSCPTCRRPNPQPMRVGIFGQPRTTVVSDPPGHRIALIGRKRCPVCAARLKVRDTQQACTACDAVTFADIAQVNTFLRTLDAKLPRTLLVSGLLGLVPVIGVVPAIIYYRLSLIASLRGYMPAGAGCLTRWALRLASIALIALQPVPVLGALAIPIMCAMSYAIHRQVLYRSAAGKLTRTFGLDTLPAAPGGASVSAPALALAQPAAARESVSATCPNCGASSTSGANFCTVCGAEFRTAT